MTQPRSRLVSLEDTPYYHCISRCVRRAFLCGEDLVTRQSFEHRRQWLVDRMHFLASVFAIDVCAYAVMSNHYHVVMRVDAQKANNWDDLEVIRRWTQLYAGPEIAHQVLNGEGLDQAEEAFIEKKVAQWRERLFDLSWFMRCLNEFIARRANHEDHCKGRFWEGRFKSQALLDERAVLTCMAYVDLNPIRANLAELPEQSDYTSIQQRIRQPLETPLLPCTGSAGDSPALPFTLKEYIEFVEWSGRMIRKDKRGFIAESAPPILQRLHMEHAPVIEFLGSSEHAHLSALGPVSRLRSLAERVGKAFIKGLWIGRRLCPEPVLP